MEINKILEMNDLLDIYGKLLTDKQLEAMNLYYLENLSFGEIGEELNISRQAAYDTIKKSEQLLYGYEQTIGVKKLQLDTENFSDIICIKLDEFSNKYRTNLNENQLKDIEDIKQYCKEIKV